MKLLITLILAITINSFAQWEKVYTNNTWANGAAIFSHKNILFQKGGSSINQVLRSDDHGTTWTDISSSFPTDFYYMLSYNDIVFAVMPTVIGQSKYSFYVSTDDGITWIEKSKIDRGYGNGAILSMASDGNNLFAVSNRRSIYKSTDEGNTWTEQLINYTGTSGVLGFAVSGNTYFAVLEGVGCVFSIDAGLNWSLKNSNSIINFITKINNDVWGFGSGFSGMFKFNKSTNTWEDNFVPSSFSMPISIGTNGVQLISTVGDFLTGNRKYYSSIDNGSNWTELTTATIGLKNNILSQYSVAGNSSFYFAASWMSSNGVITYSIYRLPLNVTQVEIEQINPTIFQLSQNYPNPFNPSTVIRFTINVSGFTSLKVYDVVGREAATLVNENLSAGSYDVKFNASEMPSGLYFYTLQTAHSSETKKMILTK